MNWGTGGRPTLLFLVHDMICTCIVDVQYVLESYEIRMWIIVNCDSIYWEIGVQVLAAIANTAAQYYYRPVPRYEYAGSSFQEMPFVRVRDRRDQRGTKLFE